MDKKVSVPSLDWIAAYTSQKIIEVTVGKSVKKGKKVSATDVENLVTKALGVLQSQGVYAMALFLFSRSGSKDAAKDMNVEEFVATNLLSWLWPLREPSEVIKKLQGSNELSTDKRFQEVNKAKQEMLQSFADLTANLDNLLLVRDLYEQTLIYARYGAKAAKGE